MLAAITAVYGVVVTTAQAQADAKAMAVMTDVRAADTGCDGVGRTAEGGNFPDRSGFARSAGGCVVEQRARIGHPSRLLVIDIIARYL